MNSTAHIDHSAITPKDFISTHGRGTLSASALNPGQDGLEVFSALLTDYADTGCLNYSGLKNQAHKFKGSFE